MSFFPRLMLVGLLLALPLAAQAQLFGGDPRSMLPTAPLQTPAQRAAEAESEAGRQDREAAKDEQLREVETGPEAPFGASLFRGRFAQESFQGFNPDYVVGVGDRINLQMWGAVDVQTVLEVDSQGNIFIPRVGPVKVLNVRNAELNEVIGRNIREVYRENVGVYAALSMADPVRVFVTGNVKAPGLYAAHGADSLLHFLDRAGGVDSRTGSYLDVRVLRGGEVRARANLYDFLLQGDLPLLQFHDGDTIVVGPRKSVAKVSGLVRREATFEFERVIRLHDLLDMARLDQRATHVRIIRNQTPLREAEYVALSEGTRDIHIVSGDEVHVFEDRRIGSVAVSVEGEFSGLSQFVLPYNATLQDLIDRIEFTDRSNRRGIQLFRRSIAERQKEMLHQTLDKLEESVLTARSGTRAEAELRVREAELILEFVERARDVQPQGRLVLHQGFDPSQIHLEDGDVLRIPRSTNTVAVQGEVFFPTAFAHQPGKRVSYYIEQAGGLTQTGRGSERIFLMRPNGELVDGRGGTLLARPRVQPGDEIMVLPKIQIKTFQFTSDLAEVIANIALTAGVVLSL